MQTNAEVVSRNIKALAKVGVRLPTFAQLADPSKLPAWVGDSLGGVGPDDAHARNLFRVHWFNDASRRGLAEVPGHVVLPEAITGVRAPIVVLLGDRFPMIRAHKVLAAYGVLAPRLVTGAFDVERHRALWPSTGNYCRGGVAISKVLGARGVAILPEEMSAERFRWLEHWVQDNEDIVKTPGSESNVKEIYDACARLGRDPKNFILNQFAEYPNYVVHSTVTGPALESAFLSLEQAHPGWRLAGFVSATGSAGTIAAGDYLKERHGSFIVAAEASECPTLLRNGYGAHNIQGIGDKHVPLIHNVMNTDVVAGISDAATDSLWAVANSPEGQRWLVEERGVAPEVVDQLVHFGFSSWCNVLAAAKTARSLKLGPDDVIVTVATDGAEMYASERERIVKQRFGGRFDAGIVESVFARWVDGLNVEDLLELRREDRDRIFNLGYFTWVEQQGVPLADFEARRSQDFWRGEREKAAGWDKSIAEFDAELAREASR